MKPQLAGQRGVFILKHSDFEDATIVHVSLVAQVGTVGQRTPFKNKKRKLKSCQRRQGAVWKISNDHD